MRSVLLLLVVAACDGSTEELPVCTTPGSVALHGSLDGDEIEDSLTVVSMANEDLVGSTSELVLSFTDTGLARIELEYFDTLNGEGHDARGYVDLSEQGGLVAGNCNIDGFFSTVRWDEDMRGGTFTLRGLRAQPFCDGRTFDGVLHGCFRVPD